MWKILTIDASHSSNQLTKMLLDDLSFMDQKLSITKSCNLADAKEILQKEDDIAVILMDLTIEGKEEGLEFIHFIRHGLKNKKVRIILRTGYPDILPEKEIICDYEIDGFFPIEVDSKDQIEIAIMTAIRSYNQIVTTEKILQGLAGSIAHELRTPLNTVSLSAQNIKDNIDDRDILEKNLNIIQDTTKSAHSIIDILLNNMRNQEVDISQFSVISISESTKEALELYPFRDEERSRIELNINNDFNVIGLKSLFHYVLFNLIKNSLYYFPSFANNKIIISIDSREDEHILTFEDHGPGIASDKIENIFESFVTIDKSGGTGLGLPFCRRVIESFSGTIHCESEVDQYTRFILSFPKEDLELREKNIESTRAKTKILVVDDDHLGVKVIKMLLKDQLENVDIDEAFNGYEATKKAKDNHYDLILMDLEMPKMNGIEAAKAIRSFSDVIIIAHTSLINARKKVLEAGMNDYVLKGETQILIRTICKWSLINNIPEIEKADKQSSNNRILLADDQDVNRLVQKRFLNKNNFEVDCVENGQELLDLYKEKIDENQRYGAIIVDLNMPVMGGFDAAREIFTFNEENNISNPPIIACSGNSSKEEMQSLLKLGMADYYLKGDSLEYLIKMINFWIAYWK